MNLQNIYEHALVKSYRLTLREVDVIACLLENQATKKIAPILGLSIKGVDAHVLNIMHKFNKNARSSVIEFVKKSSCSQDFHAHYLELVAAFEFLKTLEKIRQQIKPQDIICKISCKNESLKKHIETDLRSLNIACFARKKEATIISIELQDSYYQTFFNVLYQLFPDSFVQEAIDQFKENTREKLNVEHSSKNSNQIQIEPDVQRRSFLLKKFLGFIIIGSVVCGLFVRYEQAKRVPIHSDFAIPKVVQNQPLFFGNAWEIPRQDNLFVGRKILLDELHQILQNKSGNKSIPLAISACAGLGGIGKTQLALRYVHQSAHLYTFRAWFPSENIDILHQKYLNFAKALGFNGKNSSHEAALYYVKTYLENHPGWLIVFDNVNSYKEIQPFLPEKGGSIILTTRQRNWPSNFNVVSVNLLTETESTKMLEKLAKIEMTTEHNAAKELVKLLGYLPLAIAQAAAYIYQNKISIKEYLVLYKKYELELLNEGILPAGETSVPVSITWNISFKAISEEAKLTPNPTLATEILTVCAYLSPDKISRRTLLDWLNCQHPNLKNTMLILNKNISLLWKYSIINYDGDYISMHRLVQAVLRQRLIHAMKQPNSPHQLLDLNWYSSLLKFFLDNESDFKSTSSFSELLKTRDKFLEKFKGHLNDNIAELKLTSCVIYFFQEKFEDFLKSLNDISEYIDQKSTNIFLKGSLRYLYSAYYRKKGDFKKAYEEIEKAEKYSKRLEKNSDISIKKREKLKGKIIYNKASICYVINKKKQFAERDQDAINIAIKSLKEAIKIFKKTGEKREELRNVELRGRFLLLLNKGHQVIEELTPYLSFIENGTDGRTSIFCYMTLAEACSLEKNYKQALAYCNKAKHISENLQLKGETARLNKTIHDLNTMKY